MRTRCFIRMTGCVIVLLSAASCVREPRPTTGTMPMTRAQPTIELLGFPDCPNTPAMRHNLRGALALMGKGWSFADTNQEALDEGDTRRGWPAPTILVNGRDLFGMPPPVGAAMGCRVYPGGVPEAGAIADRLRVAAGAR
ncbi:MAG: hypothetical protein IT438_03995 [Phycisphaerales bacterium]|nr:hypothetical protein [Phycisphaerales bacterium]